MTDQRKHLLAYVFLVVVSVAALSVTTAAYHRTDHLARANRATLAELCRYEHYDYGRRQTVDRAILQPFHLSAAEGAALGMNAEQIDDVNDTFRARNEKNAMILQDLLDTLKPPAAC